MVREVSEPAEITTPGGFTYTVKNPNKVYGAGQEIKLDETGKPIIDQTMTNKKKGGLNKMLTGFKKLF